MNLDHRIAIVTGAGSGIGAATAEALAASGASVVVTDISEAAAEQTANVITQRGQSATALVQDVTSLEQWEQVFEAANATFGAPNALVNNAGVTFEWSDWRNGLFWWIQSVYVSPDSREQGVFTAMYHEVQKLARETPDVIGIRLYAERDNQRALRTYFGLGMHETDYKLLEYLIDH